MIDQSVFLGYTTLRKCPECKNQTTLETELDKLVYHKESFHHISCLKTYITSRARKKMSDEEADQFIAGLKEETEKHGFSLIVRNHLKKHLICHYNLIDLSRYEYQKLEEIFAGTFKNMRCGIPPESIIDMLQQKQKAYDAVMRKYKIKPDEQVNYLLGMIIKDYPSYVDYMEKRRIERERHAAEAKEQKIDMTYFAVKPRKTQQDILEDDDY